MFSLNVAATTGIYTYGPTLPVHTALPIWSADARRPRSVAAAVASEVHRSRAAHVGHDRRQRKGGGGGGPVKAQFDAVEAMRAHGRRYLPGIRRQQLRRASCRDRVCQYVLFSVVSDPLKNKK